MFPFILSTNVFQEFLSHLESTVGNKLNLRDFNFSYIDITNSSQVTFNAFIKYILSNDSDLILVKITQVNSLPSLQNGGGGIMAPYSFFLRCIKMVCSREMKLFFV